MVPGPLHKVRCSGFLGTRPYKPGYGIKFQIKSWQPNPRDIIFFGPVAGMAQRMPDPIRLDLHEQLCIAHFCGCLLTYLS